MGGATQEVEAESEESEETPWTCPVCSNDEEGDSLDDGAACSECSFVCPECNEIGELDEGLEIDYRPLRGGVGCSGCFTQCENCNDVLLTIDMVTGPNGDVYCDNCYSEMFTTCYSCDEEVESTWAFRCGGCEEYFCESCWQLGSSGCCEDCTPSSNSRLRDWDYQGSLSYLSLPDESTRVNHRPILYFGVELEIDGGDMNGVLDELAPLTPDDSLFWMKEDGSLGSDGVEIATQPASLTYHREAFPWQNICATARHHGYKSHETDCCGLHIHISRRGLQEGERIKLALFVYSHHNQMVAFARRSSNGYSAFKPTRDAIAEKGRTSSRYEAVNFIPRNTVEFRLFRGTLKAPTILATIQFCHALCLFVRKESFPHVVQPLAWMRYIAFVRGHSSDYPELLSYLEARHLT